MKKLISVILCLAMMLTLAACGGSGAAKMTMGTGGTSGTYYAFGGVLGQYIKNNAGIDVTVVSTDGSKANIESIAAGDYMESPLRLQEWLPAGKRSLYNKGYCPRA